MQAFANSEFSPNPSDGKRVKRVCMHELFTDGVLIIYADKHKIKALEQNQSIAIKYLQTG